MKHSILITVIALSASTAYVAGNGIAELAIVFILAFGVFFVGLPHGGLDHRVGGQLFSTIMSGSALASPLFYVSYLFVAALVVAGWYLLPITTISVFFGLAAWHFGLEEEETVNFKATKLQHVVIAARGGMVIWCCSAFRTTEVGQLLEMISPTGLGSGQVIASTIAMWWPFFVGLVVFDTMRVCRSRDVVQAAAYLVRLLAFGFMFACCPVLLSFAIYFCGWHSIKGIFHLRDQFEGSNADFAVALLPMSVLAIGLFACFIALYQIQLSFPDATTRTVFIGLSAVAVPHLMLHVVTDSQALARKFRIESREGLHVQCS